MRGPSRRRPDIYVPEAIIPQSTWLSSFSLRHMPIPVAGVAVASTTTKISLLQKIIALEGGGDTVFAISIMPTVALSRGIGQNEKGVSFKTAPHLLSGLLQLVPG